MVRIFTDKLKKQIDTQVIRIFTDKLKYLCISVLSVSSVCQPVLAQKPPNEFSVYCGGGVPVLLSNGASASGFSGDAGVDFIAFVGQQVAVHVGVGLGLSNVAIKAENLKTLTPDLMNDSSGYHYDLHTTLSDYSEAQKTTFLSVPLMLHFQSKSGAQSYYARSAHAFYAMGGVKLHFLYQTEYKVSVAAMNNIAYYPELDNSAGTQAFENYGPFEGNNAAGHFKLGLFTELALEAGMKWGISESIFLYTGAYLSYGLSDPAKNQRKPLGDYTAEKHLTDLALLKFVDKINLMTAGVKLRLAFAQQTSQTPKRKKQMTGCP
jgi:hypothetical protein